ncbi:hypothetical protein BN77_p40037 [Rhizobium mesoamericanum STM3625]|uniref:Uncharacterized protein n=1 Tax=Rhizobium mesoamericanum STM3625 TaxID=1211777 RepID=K0Q6F7_9HYPH|nr:hypothetical protein BN77_p40037 [Rhizobium mesoamericanum STM3625]
MLLRCVFVLDYQGFGLFWFALSLYSMSDCTFTYCNKSRAIQFVLLATFILTYFTKEDRPVVIRANRQ